MKRREITKEIKVKENQISLRRNESFQGDKDFSARAKEHISKKSIAEQNIKVNYNIVDVIPKKILSYMFVSAQSDPQFNRSHSKYSLTVKNQLPTHTKNKPLSK